MDLDISIVISMLWALLLASILNYMFVKYWRRRHKDVAPEATAPNVYREVEICDFTERLKFSTKIH